MKWSIIIGALFALAGCGRAMQAPTPGQTVGSVGQSTTTPAPRATAARTGATAGDGTAVPSQPSEATTAGAHSYEGDRANSITVKAGDVFTIHNPDFSRGYTFKIVSIAPDHITVSTNEPNVTIRDNGGKMPYFLHATESYATGEELPIGWARFTPREKTPVVQTYSMQPGATVTKGGED